MGYPFVPAFYDYGPRRAPVRAFVVHMAEGGGTVGYLSRANPNRVSVHYVIERGGRIVQMLREDRVGGHVNPAKLRTTDGPDPYGATVRREVMGSWDRDPNQATIAVEVEGFASTGPDPAQTVSLRELVADVRSRYPTMGLLGHRDFQDYKACPGRRIPWAVLGGHGPYEVDMPGLRTRPADQLTRGVARMALGAEVIRLEDRARITLTAAVTRQAVGPFHCEDLDDAQGYLVDVSDASCWVRTSMAGYTADTDDLGAYNAGVDAAATAALTARRP